MSWPLCGEAIAEQNSPPSLLSTSPDTLASSNFVAAVNDDQANFRFSLSALRAEIAQKLPTDIAFRLPSESYWTSAHGLAAVELEFVTAQLLDPLGLRADLLVCGSSSVPDPNLRRADCIAGALVAIAQQIGDPWGEGLILINLGETLAKQKHYEAALVKLNAGLQLIQAQEAKGLEASAYKYLGMLHQTMDNREMAMEYFERAIAISEDVGTPLAEQCRELRSMLDQALR